jgi:DNA-binding CsgD family transcriptional regulator
VHIARSEAKLGAGIRVEIVVRALERAWVQ